MMVRWIIRVVAAASIAASAVVPTSLAIWLRDGGGDR